MLLSAAPKLKSCCITCSLILSQHTSWRPYLLGFWGFFLFCCFLFLEVYLFNKDMSYVFAGVLWWINNAKIKNLDITLSVVKLLSFHNQIVVPVPPNCNSQGISIHITSSLLFVFRALFVLSFFLLSSALVLFFFLSYSCICSLALSTLIILMEEYLGRRGQ